MKYTKLTLMISGLLLSFFTLTVAAKAQGSRSYIAPSGSDNRQCSRSQPCRTFDGALAKTDEGGEIMALETSIYDPTTITKSVTLTAAPGADVVIKATSGSAVTINLDSSEIVVLRGLKLIGPGQNSNVKGVLLVSETNGLTIIENCVISGFSTGIYALTDNNSARLAISDSVVRSNQTGLTAHFSGTDANGVLVNRTRFESNVIGAQISGPIPLVVKECVASGNIIGFLADVGKLVISNSSLAKNQKGIEARGISLVYLGSTTITGNGIGIATDTVVHTMGNNMIIQNEIDHSVPSFAVITPV